MSCCSLVVRSWLAQVTVKIIGSFGDQMGPGKLCERAEAFSTRLTANTEGLNLDARGLNRAPGPHKSFGIFQGIEVSELAHDHHQSLVPGGHVR